MRVEDILRTKGRAVVTIEGEATVEQAVQRLRVKGIGALVVSGDGNRIEGIFSERDVTGGLARYGVALLRMTVARVMTPNVATCSPDDTLKRVAMEMTERRIRHIPVVENGRLAGLVSIGDVVKNRLDELELETNVMRDVYLAR